MNILIYGAATIGYTSALHLMKMPLAVSNYFDGKKD
jgi:hypothetical protein